MDKSVLNTRSINIITKTKSTYPLTSEVKRLSLIHAIKPWSLAKSNSSTMIGINKGIATTRSVATMAMIFPNMTSFLCSRSCWSMPFMVHVGFNVTP